MAVSRLRSTINSVQYHALIRPSIKAGQKLLGPSLLGKIARFHHTRRALFGAKQLAAAKDRHKLLQTQRTSFHASDQRVAALRAAAKPPTRAQLKAQAAARQGDTSVRGAIGASKTYGEVGRRLMVRSVKEHTSRMLTHHKTGKPVSRVAVAQQLKAQRRALPGLIRGVHPVAKQLYATKKDQAAKVLSGRGKDVR